MRPIDETMEGDMICPNKECNYEDEELESFSPKYINSGKGFNHTFGMEEHWFEAEVKCPKCGRIWEMADSSL